jgi:hypothetical protein
VRVLLDDVATDTYMGWAGLKNGELLQAAENDGFRRVSYRRPDACAGAEPCRTPPRGRRASAIQSPITRENFAKIIAAIDSAAPRSFQRVECGKFTRRKPPAQS